MTNELELKAELVRNGISQKEMAGKLGIDVATLYRKFKGDSDFSRSELQIIRSILGLSDKRFVDIFFTSLLALMQVNGQKGVQKEANKKAPPSGAKIIKHPEGNCSIVHSSRHPLYTFARRKSQNQNRRGL